MGTPTSTPPRPWEGRHGWAGWTEADEAEAIAGHRILPWHVCSLCGAESERQTTYNYETGGSGQRWNLVYGWPRFDTSDIRLEGWPRPAERWQRQGLLGDLDPVAYDGVLWCRDCAREAAYGMVGAAERTRERRALVAHVPGQPDGLTLERYAGADAEAAKAVEEIRRWLEDPSRNLYLWGDTGRGKTTAAALAALDYFDNVASNVEWVHVVTHLNRLKASFDGDKSRPKVRLNGALLVVDDLGLENVTPWSRDVVAEWVITREAEGRPMIVTSNYSPSTLADHFAKGADGVVGRRLVSRIVGNGAVVAEVQGPDRRIGRQPEKDNAPKEGAST